MFGKNYWAAPTSIGNIKGDTSGDIQVSEMFLVVNMDLLLTWLTHSLVAAPQKHMPSAGVTRHGRPSNCELDIKPGVTHHKA